MSVYSGPKISNDGLVLSVDAANLKSVLNVVEVLVVAGGGGGGTGGGGGGAGGLIYSSSYSVTPGSAITATVGNGGINTSTWGGAGGAGGNSVFGALTAIGGGAGQHRAGSTSAGIGGSGGGDAGGSGVTLSNATSGQGFSGGNSPKNGTTFEEPGGGGGGAGGAGGNASTPTAPDNATVNATAAGAGGPGLPFNISGSVVYYAGGGGGSNRNGVGRPGGIGGGGTGGTSPTAGTPNTGGGGGGTGYSGYGGGGTSAIGGSGIVVVRYPGAQKATGGTITSVGGYTIHTFTASGTFTPNGWADLSGVGNTGTLSNVTYASSPSGNMLFDVESDNVLIAHNSSFTFGGNFTVGAWIKVNSFNTAGIWNVISKKVSYNNTQPGWSCQYDYRTTGVLQFRNNNGSVLNDSTPTSPLNNSALLNQTANWTNSVWVISGTTVTFYINGQNCGSSTVAYVATDTTSDVYIGKTVTSAGDPSLLMNITGVTIHNRALSASEIQQNFNATRGRYGI